MLGKKKIEKNIHLMTGLLPAMTARWRGVYPSSSFLQLKKIYIFWNHFTRSWARIISFHYTAIIDWPSIIFNVTCWGVQAVLKGSSQRRQESLDLNGKVLVCAWLSWLTRERKFDLREEGNLTNLRGRCLTITWEGGVMQRQQWGCVILGPSQLQIIAGVCLKFD